jgi:hypothetical protein
MLLLAGCGAGGDPGGGHDHLPVSGAGPFAPLTMQPGEQIDPPIVLVDSGANLDDPAVLADGDRLTVWVTAKRKSGIDIERADAPSLLDGFGPLEPALAADQPWEGGAVSAPSLLPGSPWLLFYSAAGAIGYAVSSDGRTWQKAGPTLSTDGLDEGVALGAPAAIRVDDRVLVYYPAAGRLWAASAPFADLVARRPVTWQRVNGDPTRPGRNPVIDGVPYGVALGRPFARAADTPVGRRRFDLYFTVETGLGPNNGPATTCGFASSFQPVGMQVLPQPIVPPKLAVRAPTETPYGDGAVLLYIQVRGVRDALAAARAP